MADIKVTMKDRGARYGAFADNAATAQALKVVFKAGCSWDKLPPVARESLDQIAIKIARAVTGGPDQIDTFHDIAGYAILVEQFYIGQASATSSDQR